MTRKQQKENFEQKGKRRSCMTNTRWEMMEIREMRRRWSGWCVVWWSSDALLLMFSCKVTLKDSSLLKQKHNNHHNGSCCSLSIMMEMMRLLLLLIVAASPEERTWGSFSPSPQTICCPNFSLFHKNMLILLHIIIMDREMSAMKLHDNHRVWWWWCPKKSEQEKKMLGTRE